MKIKINRDTQINDVFHKDGDVVDVDAKMGKVLCECGVAKEVKVAKPKKEGK